MAYIHARNLDDVFMAQGFVTAQERLFQMQLTRLVIQGRVCEFAGEVAKNLDIRMRTIGLHRMAKKQAGLLNDKTRGYFQKYVDGINAFIEHCPLISMSMIPVIQVKYRCLQRSASLCQ